MSKDYVHLGVRVISGSASRLPLLTSKHTSLSLSSSTACLENPHFGAAGLPFMQSRTGEEERSD